MQWALRPQVQAAAELVAGELMEELPQHVPEEGAGGFGQGWWVGRAVYRLQVGAAGCSAHRSCAQDGSWL